MLQIEAWRIEYNSDHLHNSPGYMTPDEFAERCAAEIEEDAARGLSESATMVNNWRS